MSLMDTLAILTFMAHPFKVGMAPNFAVPLCVERIRKGESLVIYPEAHHEKGSRLLRFKTGAVRAALEAGVPLIPAAITGSQNVITPEPFIIHPGDVHIYIGKPMDIFKQERESGRSEARQVFHA
jgi:1-acyl-sn-glycerol-3-phosphate acyltransferase